MSVEVSEYWRGVTGDQRIRNVPFIVKGATSDSEAMVAAQQVIPLERFGKFRRAISIEEVGGGYYMATGHFSVRGGVQYEFNYQAPAVHIMQSLFTRGRYTASEATEASDFGGAINVVLRDGRQEVEGIDLPSPAPTNIWTYFPAASVVNQTYELAVEGMCGAVNATDFMNRPALSMRLVSVSGAIQTDEDWQIRFGFQYSANRTNFQVGDITVPFVGGHDVMWAYYEDDYDSDSKRLIKYPRTVYVEQVFPEVSFGVLGF